MDPTLERRLRRGLTAALALYGLILLRHPEAGGLIDGVDLAIHETGHLVFAPFGEFMTFLGGTAFQLIMPAAFVGYFLHRGDRHAASVAGWWIGQNCWNISVYMADARSQELPLVGGGEHDWAYLLGSLGLLRKDQELADAVRFLGVTLYVFSLWYGWMAATGIGKDPER